MEGGEQLASLRRTSSARELSRCGMQEATQKEGEGTANLKLPRASLRAHASHVTGAHASHVTRGAHCQWHASHLTPHWAKLEELPRPPARLSNPTV